MKASLTQRIKSFYFNHNGRLDRETFAVGLVALVIFAVIGFFILAIILSLFLPGFIRGIISLVYLGYVLYAKFVIVIKRLKDLNLPSLLSVLIIIPFINLFLFAFLCLMKGKKIVQDDLDDEYEYEIPSLKYSGPKLILLICYLALVLAGIIGVRSFLQWRDFGKLVSMTISNQNKDKSVAAKEFMEKMPKSFRVPHVGLVSSGGEYMGAGSIVSSHRFLVTKKEYKDKINLALSKNQQVVFQTLTKEKANVTRFVVGNDSHNFYVFEMDQAVGTPEPFSDENKKILEEMGAF